MTKNIYIAADHRGFSAKNAIVSDFKFPAGYNIVDLGPAKLDPKDDYNDAAIKVAKKVSKDKGSFGILLCGSAHGVCIQANRFKKVRAIMGLTPELAKIAREHNDANVICLSADFQDFSEESRALSSFLNTDFSGEKRHIRRIKRLSKGVW